jgi:hypothetical protein
MDFSPQAMLLKSRSDHGMNMKTYEEKILDAPLALKKKERESMSSTLGKRDLALGSPEIQAAIFRSRDIS